MKFIYIISGLLINAYFHNLFNLLNAFQIISHCYFHVAFTQKVKVFSAAEMATFTFSKKQQKAACPKILKYPCFKVGIKSWIELIMNSTRNTSNTNALKGLQLKGSRQILDEREGLMWIMHSLHFVILFGSDHNAWLSGQSRQTNYSLSGHNNIFLYYLYIYLPDPWFLFFWYSTIWIWIEILTCIYEIKIWNISAQLNLI